VYAIKKTVLKVLASCPRTVKDEMERMLHEVRLFASISNPHIVRYNHSWIEVADTPTDLSYESGVEQSEEQIVALESPFIEFVENIESEVENATEYYKDEINNPTTTISIFIQMELCEETLEDYLNRRGDRFSDEDFNEALRIARQIIDGIYAIHQEYKIIHRDLSLRNIFIGRDNVIRIGDFGLAIKTRHLIPILSCPLTLKPSDTSSDNSLDLFSLDEDLLTTGIGTTTFAVPEQRSKLLYDQKADIYSLGLILLALFSPTQTIRSCRLQGPSKEFIESYPEIGELIKRMTNENPECRPAAAELKDLNLFGEGALRSAWEILGFDRKKCLLKIGKAGKLKTRYVKITKRNILLYSKKADKKARLCYPLKDCKVIPIQMHKGRKRKMKRNWSFNNLTDEIVSGPFNVIIEHPQLETLHLLMENMLMA